MTYAIYFEFGRESDIYQWLFIPSTALGAHTVKPTLAYKELTTGRVRRVWNLKTNPAYRLSSEIPRDFDDLIEHEILQLTGLHVYLTSILVAPDWEATGAFPVEVTVSDLLALKEHEDRMPPGLQLRIKQLRAAAGLPPLPEASR